MQYVWWLSSNTLGIFKYKVMRKPFLCLIEEYSYFLKSCFSAMVVEIFQGCAGVEIYSNIFLFLLITFLEEFICTEPAIIQAFRDVE